ncbi:hypothetical protein PTSG_03434 [Salpingoeca rosetta]|uniref:Uncharacterized protein n=1 Tax=Salpingoeca rosetta (strain ATCC 50818 / BSB-021) TaxID=946362 RepID=F2U568_SALR5|nr:uncharacterized protein PTSG_03434 [Salpingoeca rosetta]EGD82784.1 hypothetical protein PTSG_03434 [Salpingoeca rosetta]|eukprot:XP_004996020.1 hypothetical protein PTSG_03434 [Salpingoeca rosetta]
MAPSAPITGTPEIVLQLGQVTDSNFYRWSVIKRLLQDDQRKRGGKDPFVVLEYGSNLGSISIPLASTFPLATVISVESGDVDPAQRHSLPYEVKVMGKVKFHEQVLTTLGVDNNAVCKASVSMAMLQRLQTARVRFDFQLLLDFVHHIDADSFEELSAFLRALVPLARVTVIEIPRVDADAADANAWFSKGSAIQTVREALSLLPYTRVDSLVGGRQTIQLIAIENTAVSEGLALAPGHAFCQQAFDVLRCENELQSAWCPGTAGANAQQGGGGGGRGAVNLRPDAIRHGGSKQQQQQEQESKSKVTTTTTTTRRRPTTTKKYVKL